MGRSVLSILGAAVCVLGTATTCQRPEQDLTSLVERLVAEVRAVMNGEAPALESTVESVSAILDRAPASDRALEVAGRRIDVKAYSQGADKVAELTLPVETGHPHFEREGAIVKVQSVPGEEPALWITVRVMPSRDGEATKFFLEKGDAVRVGAEVECEIGRPAELSWLLMKVSMDEDLRREFSRSSPEPVDEIVSAQAAAVFESAFERARDR